MRRAILMPKLGLTMAEGTIVEWTVAPGDSFEEGQILFVVESEKSAVEIPAEGSGSLLEIGAEPGATLAVGEAIGYWDDGEAGEAAAEAGGTVNIAPPAPVEAAVVAQSAELPASRVDRPAHDGQRVPVTPLARRLAAQRGIDLATVQGSGPRGRIRARDLDNLEPARESAAPAAVDSTAGSTLRAPSALEKTIAQRLTTAKRDIPHFYLSVEAEVSALQKLRRQLNEEQSAVRFTLNHFILAAVGRALADMPELNRVWTDEGILTLATSDVGMAVNTERGLVVPVLRDIGKQPLGVLARAAGEAIDRAQKGRQTSGEMTGGAISVSNAGMHDVTYMSSIINPGQAMILGVGSVRELFRPDAEGQPVLSREMGLVLSADHRVLDGVSALTFLKRITHYLEHPLMLLVS